jgi:hypothetical protein
MQIAYSMAEKSYTPKDTVYANPQKNAPGTMPEA